MYLFLKESPMMRANKASISDLVREEKSDVGS
jgi:hypothetical protein